MKTYSERIAKGAFAALVLGLLGTVLGYVLRIYLARNLSLSEFGLFYSVLALLSFAGVIKDFGLSSAVAKAIPEFQVKKKFSSILAAVKFSVYIQAVIGIVLTTGILLLSDWISAAFFHEASAKIVLQILAIEFLIGFSVLKVVLQGFQKIKYYASIEPIRIALVFAFLAVFIRLGAQGVAWSYLIAAIIINLALAAYTVKICSSRSGDKPPLASNKKFLLFGLTVLTGTVASMLISTTDTLMITFFLSLKDVALYQVSMSTSQLLLVFSSAICVVTLPIASELWSSGKKDTLGTAVWMLTKSLFICIIPFAFIFVAFPELLLGTLFGSSYASAPILLQMLSVGMIFCSLYSVMTTVMIGVGRPGSATKIMIFIAALNFVLNLAMINIFGIAGAAASAIISYVTATAVSLVTLRKHIAVGFSILDIAKIFACGVLSVEVIFVVKNALVTDPVIEAVIGLVVGVGVYSCLVLLSKAVKRSDIKMLDETNIMVPKSFIRFLYRVVRR